MNLLTKKSSIIWVYHVQFNEILYIILLLVLRMIVPVVHVVPLKKKYLLNKVLLIYLNLMWAIN